MTERSKRALHHAERQDAKNDAEKQEEEVLESKIERISYYLCPVCRKPLQKCRCRNPGERTGTL